MSTINSSQFVKALTYLLEETFENPIGLFLDKGNSLIPTLESITAEQASIPVGGKCASLAAQVAHITFYFEAFERYAIQGDHSPVDWGQIWRTVEKVTPEEWQALRENLKKTYQHLRELVAQNEVWNEDTMTGSFAMVAHTAYHLGEIRQALCTLR
jgi:hypothetical protein